MRIVGLDLGSKTCGVAQSDAGGTIALGVKTLTFESEDYEAALILVKDLCQELAAEKIVVGYPKHLNNDVGERARIAQIFADILSQDLNIEVILWDERLTTVAAEKVLLSADVSRKKRKKVVDKVAATYILQGYLDAQNNDRSKIDE